MRMRWVKVEYLRYEDDFDGVIDISPHKNSISLDDGEEDTVFFSVESLNQYLLETFNIKLQVPAVTKEIGKWHNSSRTYDFHRVFVRREEINDYRAVIVNQVVGEAYDIMELNFQDVDEFILLEWANVHFERHGYVPDNDMELIAFRANECGYDTVDKIHRWFPNREIVKEVLLEAYDIIME